MKARAVLFQIHLWTGLTLGILLALLGLSGSMLVYHDELLEMTQAPVPHAQAPGIMLPLDALVASAREKFPAKRANATVMLPEKQGDALLVRFQTGSRPGPQRGTDVYVDPASAKVLDVRSAPYNAFIGAMHDLHGRLLIPGREGRQVVGWLGVAMLLLGCTGIVIWWPRRGQWNAGFRIRRNARGYWLYRDLHGAVGIWGLVVFLIVSFSGVAIAFPDTVRSIVTLGAAQRSAPKFDPRNGPAVEPIKDREPMGLDATVALVKTQMPNADVRSISIPAEPRAALRVMIGSAEDGPVSTLYVDPWRAKIVATRNLSADGADTFMAWQRPLHEGSGWGAFWRILVFLSGLLPSLFVTTGIVMWVKKRRARVRVVPSAASEGANA
jgi:uncharacterized iron-regulated membrane protein